MSISTIKEQILRNEAVLLREQPEDSKFMPSYDMARNEATEKLVILKAQLEEEVRKKVRINFVKIDEQTKTLLGKSDFVMDHRALASEMARAAQPSMPLGTVLSSFQIANLNNKMTDVCLEIGVNTQLVPELYMDADFQRTIHSEEQFTNIVESMIEKMVKNRDFDEEGHVLQTLYLMKTFLKKAPTILQDSEDPIDLFVLVPRISPSLVEEYKNKFSSNMRTVAVNEKANITLQSFDELLNLVVGDQSKSVKKVKKTK